MGLMILLAVVFLGIALFTGGSSFGASLDFDLDGPDHDGSDCDGDD